MKYRISISVGSDPAHRAAFLYDYLFTHTFAQKLRKNLVKENASVRVNWRKLKCSVAGKRACRRTKSGLHWSYSLAVHKRKVGP